MKEKILFVTKGGESCDEGFSYVLELAKTLAADIAVLMIYPEQILTTFEDVMAAAAYAEAGDFKTVKTLMDEQLRAIQDASGKKIRELEGRCRDASIGITCSEVSGDTATSIREYLKDKPSIDMVLLSPDLSANKKVLDIKKLIRHVSKPIVSISKPAEAGA